MTKFKLWPGGFQIRTLGVAGPWASGKTLFCLSIDPARTLCIDLERSSANYIGLGFDRIDLPDLIREKGLEYTGAAAYKQFLEIVKNLPADKYSTVVVDPIDEIESGMVDLVKASYQKYGYSSADKFYSTGGIFWGAVREHWRGKLIDIASKCETFAFTAHVRQVWKGNRPTSQLEPRGKSALSELCDLYLMLIKGQPGCPPSAEVRKSRLAQARIVDGKPTFGPLLPGRLPVATPDAIRSYLVNPPDFAALRPEEQIINEPVTEEERLELEAQIAEDKRRAAEMQLEAAQLAAKMDAAKRMAKEAASRKASGVEDAPREGDGSTTDGVSYGATEAECQWLVDSARKLGILDRVQAAIQEALVKAGVAATDGPNPRLLSAAEFKRFADRIKTLLTEKETKIGTTES